MDNEFKYKNREKEYRQEYYKNNTHKWVQYREADSFPCVYVLANTDSEIIRVGSTLNIRCRIANYFNECIYKGWGLWKWFNTMKLDKVLFIRLDSRNKAFALESILIDKYKPVLNVNDVNNTYWDKYKDSLGDLENIEELFEEYDISRFKNKFKEL